MALSFVLAFSAGSAPQVTAQAAAAPAPSPPAPPLAQPVAQTAETAVSGGRYYRQGGGFSVTDQRAMPFFRGLQRLGGVAQLGYPVSRRFFLDGFTCQAMQGGLLQYLPDTDEVVLANTFELLSRYGFDDWLYARGIPRPIRNDGSSSFAEAVQIRLSWLTNETIAQRYLAAPDGWTGPWTAADAVNRYGLPMSRPESFGLFTSQRFQRVAFQLWEQALPGLPAPGSVTPVLGGELVRDSGMLGPLATLPQAPGDDAAVPVDLTVAQRNATGTPRRAGPLTYSVVTSATGRIFPAIPAGRSADVRPATGTYVVAVLEVQNTGTQPAAAAAQRLELRDSSGGTYPTLAELSALAAAATGAADPATPVPPGATTSVALAFNVPAASGPWALEVAGASSPPDLAAPPIQLDEPAAGSTGMPAGEAGETGGGAPAAGEERPGSSAAAPSPLTATGPEAARPAVIEAAPPRSPTATAGTEHVLPGILRVRVFEVVRPFSGTPPPPSGQEYLYVRLELTNLSATDLPYGTGFIYARVRGVPVRGQPVGSSDPLGGGTLAPGATASGTVGFAVSRGAPVLSLIYNAANYQLEVSLP